MKADVLLFALLRVVVCGAAADGALREACTEDMLRAAWELAARHNLDHLVGLAVEKLGLLEGAVDMRYQQSVLRAVYRDTGKEYVQQQLCKTLEEASVPFIPLKGSVLRSYYPETWMRTSCDIDVLLHEEDLETAVQVLEKNNGYKLIGKGGHDWTMDAPGGVHLELHYSVLEEDQVVAGQQVLEQIWEHATPCEGKKYQHSLSDEMFYFYHVAHMAKHVECGGCGIRPFMDLWVLDHKVPHDAKQRERLLAKGGLLRFARVAQALERRWFCAQDSELLSEQFAQFVLSGGAFGTLQSNVAIQQNKRNGKFAYALSRIFLPYRVLKVHYPVLKKHKWLFPVFQIVRWGKVVFAGRTKRSFLELRLTAEVSAEDKEYIANMLAFLGLD